MLTFLVGVARHALRIVTFRHPGTGIPAKHGGALYVLMVIWAITQFGDDMVAAAKGGFDALSCLAYIVAFLGVTSVFLRPQALAVLLMAMSFSHVVVIGLGLSGVTSEVAFTAIDIWCCAGGLVTLNRITMRTLRAEKNNRPSEKN
jgi:hypothetical protein